MELPFLPYREEVYEIGHIVGLLREDNLEKIVKEFKNNPNPHLKSFSEFGERLKDNGYERLSDYFIELASNLLEELYVSKMDTYSVGDLLNLINSLSRFSYDVSNNKEIRNKALRNLAFVEIHRSGYEAADSVLNQLKRDGGDNLEISLIEAYKNYLKDKFSGADEFISATSKWIDYDDNPVIRLWRAEAYTSKGDYEKAKDDLDVVSKTKLRQSGLYSFLNAKVGSNLDLNGDEFRKDFESYFHLKRFDDLFPPKPQNNRPNPEGMYG